MPRKTTTNRARRERLTPKTIEAIAPPKPRPNGKSGRVEIADADVPALHLRVTSTGARSLSVVYRSPHRREDGRRPKQRVTIGPWPMNPHTPLDEKRKLLAYARARALEVTTATHRGVCVASDLADEREKARATNAERRAEAEQAKPPQHVDRNTPTAVKRLATTGQIIELFIESPQAKRRKTALQAERSLRKHWLSAENDIGDVPISELHRDHITPHLGDLLADEKYGAHNESLKHLKTAMGWAVKQGILDVAPTNLIDRAQTDPRDRALEGDEIGAFWVATEVLDAPWRQALRCLLATGARTTEMLGAPIDDFEDGLVWLRLRAKRAKTKKARRIAIPRIARDELLTLPSPTDGRFLFSCDVGRTAAKAILPQLVPVRARMAKLLGKPADTFDRDANPDAYFHVHDLRRSCGTGLGNLGVEQGTIDLVLGHAKDRVRRTYNTSVGDDSKREAIERWGESIAKSAARFES